MDSRAIAITSVMFFACTAAVIMTVTKYWFTARRSVSPRQLDEIAERLSRLEQAVDAIAVEAERISEGQRFTTKLLSERTRAVSGSMDA
jgi:hypothetical protein